MTKSADSSTAKSAAEGRSPTIAFVLMALGLAVLLLILPRIVRAARVAVWRARAPSAAEAEWRLVLTELADQAIAVDPSATPRRVGALLAVTVPACAADILVLVGSVERTRYSLPGSGRGTADGHRLRRASNSIVLKLRRKPVRGSLRTMWFPRSAAMGLVHTSRRSPDEKRLTSAGRSS